MYTKYPTNIEFLISCELALFIAKNTIEQDFSPPMRENGEKKCKVNVDIKNLNINQKGMN